MSKKIMITWFIVVFIFLGTILLIGLNHKDLTYIKLEYNIKYKTYKYIKDNNINIKLNDTYSLNIDKLNIENDNIDKYCIKGINIKNKLLLDEYNLIIKCNDEVNNGI